jgi:hypothetical protein
MPDRTPLSKVRETIEAVAVIQEQIDGLIEALTKLTSRVDAIERRGETAGRG